MKSISRNSPLALVVGAAGFLGSHLTEKLLNKGIQVVGVDNLSTGKIANLGKASKDKNFYFLNQSASEKIPLSLSRLDYAFFIISENYSRQEFLDAFDNFLEICRSYLPKIILVSAIELYDQKEKGFENLREAERRLAHYAFSKNKTEVKKRVNARIVRLAAVFGPRMHFRGGDPIVDLIKAATPKILQKEATPLDFTTRSLYIDDAINLLIKAVMHGGTAQKIYDGALPIPVKIVEVRQILLDPVWYESRGFIPTELPPWPTPNLGKTIKELSWKPQSSLVTALRETIVFFKENQINQTTNESDNSETPMRPSSDTPTSSDTAGPPSPSESFRTRSFQQPLLKLRNYLLVLVAVALITYALIYPAVLLVVDVFVIRSDVKNVVQATMEGDFNRAEQSVEGMKKGVGEINQAIETVAVLVPGGIFVNQVGVAEQLKYLLNEATTGLDHAVSGSKNLALAWRIVSGEEATFSGQTVKDLAEKSYLELDRADQDLALVVSRLDNPLFSNRLPAILKTHLENWRSEFLLYRKMVGFAKSASLLLPEIVLSEGKKNYLVLLGDETNLRPGGGMLVSFAMVTFEGGKLVNMTVDSLDNLEKDWSEKIEPPAKIKSDFGISTGHLKETNFEADFPNNAKLAQWFYAKEKGIKVAGVVNLDLRALAYLLEASGPLDLTTLKEKIDSKNLLEKAITTDKEDVFLSAVLKEFLNRMFFLSKQDWVRLVQNLSRAGEEKHLLVYLTDPSLLARLKSVGLAGVMPQQTREKAGERKEFLSLSETNLALNHSNYYLKRKISLQSNLTLGGEVTHKLVLGYQNQSPSDVWPGGRYKARLKVYLPIGTKITLATWGDRDILKEISSFSDFGRAGYSLMLELKPKEQKSLTLEYQDGKAAEFLGDRLKLKLDISKQIGGSADPLMYKVTYPLDWKAVSASLKQEATGFLTTTDLATDREFEVNFQK